MTTLFCPSCGSENPLDRSVCQKCKADLGVVKSILDTAHLHYNRALALAEEGRYPEAELEATAALELYNKDGRFHNLLATIYARQGKFSRAQEAWETTLHLNEETSSAYRSLQRLGSLSSNGPSPAPARRSAGVLDVILLLLVLMLGWLAHRYAMERVRDSYELQLKTVRREAAVQQEPASRLSTPMDALNANLERMFEEMRGQRALVEEQTQNTRMLQEQIKALSDRQSQQEWKLYELRLRDDFPWLMRRDSLLQSPDEDE